MISISNHISPEGDLVIVETMAERKKLLYEAADAFVALPGGLGTLEETAEALSWRMLRLHEKPIALCSVRGFYSSLDAFVKATISEEFASPAASDTYALCDNPIECIVYLEKQFTAPSEDHSLNNQ